MHRPVEYQIERMLGDQLLSIQRVRATSFDGAALSAHPLLKPAGRPPTDPTIAWMRVRHVDIGLFYDYLVLPAG